MIDTPFKDACGPDSVPTKGSAGTYDSEPNFDHAKRTGGLLPEKTRDTHLTPKSPQWKNPGETFKHGTSD